MGAFFAKKKKGTKNFNTPYSNPYLCVLHQNKALHNFHGRGQGSKAGSCFRLDQGLILWGFLAFTKVIG